MTGQKKEKKEKEKEEKKKEEKKKEEKEKFLRRGKRCVKDNLEGHKNEVMLRHGTGSNCCN